MDHDALLVLLADVDVSHGFDSELDDADASEDDVPDVEAEAATICYN